MANEDLFEFSAKMDVEVEKSSLDKAKGVLDAFYAKYHDRKMKVDTSDMVKSFRGGIAEIRKLYDQGMQQMAKDGFAWWDTEDDLENSFSIARNKMYDFFDDLKASFSDGSVVSGLDNILEKSLENVSIVAVDLGERVRYLKDQISGMLNELDDVDAIQRSRWGTYGFSGDNMTASQLEDRIDTLKRLVECQKELEVFNGKKFEYEVAPTGMTSSGIDSEVKQLKENLKLLKTYNLETTEQLSRRRALIEEAQNTWQWDEDDHTNAKNNIRDDEAYEAAIASLKSYIEQRQSIIQQLQDSEYELFSVDGIAEYVNDANTQITRFEAQMKELEDLRSGKSIGSDYGITGDLSEVVTALGKIETAIQSVVDAFKPLTDALANEDSAISAMVNANIADLERLKAEVQETFSNIETLSNKQFNVTNVISNGNNANNDIEQFRQFRKEARDIFKQVEELYTESIATSQKIKSTPGGVSAFLDFNATMSEFDLSDLAKRIKSKSATSLAAVIDELNEWKKVLLQFNNLRNDVEAGSFNVSKYNDTSSKVNIGSRTTDADERTITNDTNVDNNDVLNRVKALSDQVQEEFASIRAKIEETFNLATLDPQLFDVTSITQNIYQQFIELQQKISNLKFTIDTTTAIADATAYAIGNEADKANEVKEAFVSAAEAKDKFTESNKKAAASADVTTPKIKAEADAAEGAYQAFAKFSFSESAGVSEAEFNAFAANIAKNNNLKVKNASLTRGENGNAIGGNITFVDPDTLQEIRERYSVRPKEDNEDELELYRSSYTLVENTAKAEQKAANEATRRSKAIADSNKWLIEQEDLLTKQENKYKASSGSVKPLEGSSGLIQANVTSGVDATLDGLAESIRSRINDAKGGIITQDLKNEIIKDLNALSNEIQVQQARKYQSTNLRAKSIETSRDIYRNEIAALEADAKKSGVFDQMSSTISTLLSDVENFTEDTFVSFIESFAKAHSQFKAEKAKFAQKKQEEKSITEDTSKNQKIYDEAIKAQEKLYKLKKQMIGLDPESSKGQEKMREITDAQNEYNEALSVTNRKLLSIGQLQDLDNLETQFKKELGLKQQEYKSSVSTEQEAKDLKYVLSLYQKYTDAAKSLSKMQNDPSNASHNSQMAAAIQDVRNAKEELLALGIDVNDIANSELLTEDQKLALLEKQIKYKREIRDIENKAQDKEETKQNKQAQNYGKTIFNREKRYNGQIAGRISSLEDAELNPQFAQTINDYKKAYTELEDLRKKFENDPKLEDNDALTTQFQKAAINVEKLRKEILSTFKEYDKFTDIPTESILGESVFDPATMTDAKTAMMQLAVAATDGRFQFEGFNAAGTEMYGIIDKGAGVLEEVTVRFSGATNEMKAFTSGTKQVTTSWSKLGSELKKGVTQLVGRYIGFNELWQAFKQGVKYVKEIDLAMTELKKVTDETDEAYRKFLTTASKTAAAIGSTVSDFTDAASAFARLGYTLDESAKMAETAIIYKNVADGLDSVEESTESIISTMMAYGIAADDTMSIIDRFNAVGNNFAITSAGIGDAMQRSASALKEGGNTIDESIALITAANSVWISS